MLDRAKMMPKAMQVHLPNGDRHVYMFDIANATVNGHLQRIMALFQCAANALGLEAGGRGYCRPQPAPLTAGRRRSRTACRGEPRWPRRVAKPQAVFFVASTSR